MTKKQMLESIKDRGYEISQRTLERWLFQLQDVGLEYEVTSVETDHGKANRYKVTGLPNALLKLQPTERSALERYATIVSDTTTKDALNKFFQLNQFINCYDKQSSRTDRPNSTYK